MLTIFLQRFCSARFDSSKNVSISELSLYYRESIPIPRFLGDRPSASLNSFNHLFLAPMSKLMMIATGRQAADISTTAGDLDLPSLQHTTLNGEGTQRFYAGRVSETDEGRHGQGLGRVKPCRRNK